MADLNKLVEKIKEDADLKKQFASAVKENKVVEFCKNLGIETTKEEIAEFLKAKKGELSKAELDAVVGGCADSSRSVACDVCATVLSAGILCVVGSVRSGLEFVYGNPVDSCLA